MTLRHPVHAVAGAALLALVAACAGPASTPAPPRIAPPPPPPPGLERIVGRSAEAVTALLGPPSLDRTEGPSRHLQFIRPPCVLDVYLAPGPGTAGAVQVRTAAARRPDGTRMDPAACLTLVTAR